MREIRDHFRNIASAMSAQARIAGASGHSATTGNIRELVVHKFLRPHLPSIMNLRSGIVIDSEGRRSRQQDCVILDSRLPIIDLGSDSDAMFLAESVIATIEVKSHLNTSTLNDVLGSSAQTKQLTRRGEQEYHKGGARIVAPKPLPIFTYVFAFDGTSLDGLTESVARFSHDRADPHCLPGAICVLGKGIILCPHFMPVVHGNNVTLPAIKEPTMTMSRLPQDSLFAFYCRLIDDIIPLRLINYDFDAYFSESSLA